MIQYLNLSALGPCLSRRKELEKAKQKRRAKEKVEFLSLGIVLLMINIIRYTTNCERDIKRILCCDKAK